jgi:hypothetical protein
MLEDESLSKTPILTLANKQDLKVLPAPACLALLLLLLSCHCCSDTVFGTTVVTMLHCSPDTAAITLLLLLYVTALALFCNCHCHFLLSFLSNVLFLWYFHDRVFVFVFVFALHCNIILYCTVLAAVQGALPPRDLAASFNPLAAPLQPPPYAGDALAYSGSSGSNNNTEFVFGVSAMTR